MFGNFSQFMGIAQTNKELTTRETSLLILTIIDDKRLE